MNLKNIFLSIFARIWAMWGLVSFITTFLIIFPISMLSHLIRNPRKSQDFFIAISKIWMQIWLMLVGCRLTVHGKSNFKKEENYIVVFNHLSMMDIPLSCPYVPGGNKTIAKSSFSKVPIFGWFYKKGGVMVDRKNERSRRQSYEHMKQVLKQGIHMCIYPEGTRNRTNQPLKPFYDGAFRLSVETGKSILPCVLKGTNKAMPMNRFFYFLPVRLSMKFLLPVDPGAHTAKELNQIVFELMKAEVLRN